VKVVRVTVNSDIASTVNYKQTITSAVCVILHVCLSLICIVNIDIESNSDVKAVALDSVWVETIASLVNIDSHC